MKKEMCCKHLQFMWDNHLLEERSASDYFRTQDAEEIFISYVKGYRVRRSFFFFKRDTIFYHCPFCNVELISSSGVFIPRINYRFKSEMIKIGSSSYKSPFQIPMSALKEALFVTKKRCKKWPPED